MIFKGGRALVHWQKYIHEAVANLTAQY